MNWTPEQQQAITSLAPRICVDAGAGSGKTRVLIDRIVHLIEADHAELDEIVAITFTEKAAGEMKARLRRAFREKATPDDPDIMSRWRNLEQRVESARITTIHAFCAGLLRENALRQGLDPDFAVLAEDDALLLRHETVTTALHGRLDDHDEAALLLAEAWGVAELTRRLKSMLNQRAVIDRAPAVFWEGSLADLQAHCAAVAAREADDHIRRMQHDPAVTRRSKQLRDFDGACAKEDDAREVLRTAQLALLEMILEGAPVQDIRAHHAEVDTRTARGTRKTNWTCDPEELAAIQKKVKEWLNKHIPAPQPDPEIEAQSAELVRALCTVYRHIAEAWDTAKCAANGFDFDDLIARTHHTLESDQALRERAAAGIRFLLIDEFQDTDAHQLAIARLLCDAPGGPALFIVGDAKQSIYAFRGAEVEVFAQERQRATEMVRLADNFRTVPEVMAFVNDLFGRSNQLAAVETPFRPMAAHRSPAGGERVTFLLPTAEEGEKVKADEGRDREAVLLAGHIAEICAPDAPELVFDETTNAYRRAGYGDVAILLRALSNVHQYEAALRRAGIPYTLVAGQGFYERPEVLDVLALLRFVLDPHDEHALAAFLRGPFVSLSDEDLLRLHEHGPLCTVFASDDVPENLDAPAVLTRARALVADLRGHGSLAPGAFLRYLLERTQVEAVLVGQFLGVQRVSNLGKLVEKADAFSAGRTPTLHAFVQYLGEVRSQAVREGEAMLQAEGSVTIMTIHKSKGLEFPVVAVSTSHTPRSESAPFMAHRDLGLAAAGPGPDGERRHGLLDDAIRARETEESEAERARLLYVALTRARDCLLISGPPQPAEASWLGMMDETFALMDRAHGSTVGGLGWQGAIHREAALPSPAAAATPEPPAAWPERLGPVPAPASPRRVFSVSALLDAMAHGADPEEERPRDSEEDAGLGRSFAMARGTAVHAMFEHWDFASGKLPDLERIAAEAGLGLGKRKGLVTDMEAIAERFRATDLHGRLQVERRILREAPFVLNLEDAVINGTIDAMLPDGTMIDYKTGQPEDTRQARYEWQLLLYAAAAARLGKAEPREGLLVYVDVGKVHRVPITPADMDHALRQARETVARLCAG